MKVHLDGMLLIMGSMASIIVEHEVGFYVNRLEPVNGDSVPFTVYAH